MVSISLAFIPILQREIQNIKYSFLSKGYKLNLKNFLKKPSIFILPLITNLVKRVTEIEESMKSRGYIG